MSRDRIQCVFLEFKPLIVLDASEHVEANTAWDTDSHALALAHLHGLKNSLAKKHPVSGVHQFRHSFKILLTSQKVSFDKAKSKKQKAKSKKQKAKTRE
jgi:hypothetical protein